jgi:dehydrogenase/reductase SDR family protein 7B
MNPLHLLHKSTTPLRGQVIWITGASAGIGKALAVALAAQGATLVLSARRVDALHAVLALCQAKGNAPHVVMPLDVTDSLACDAAYWDILRQTGKVDWLINNAGVSQRALVMDTLPEVDRQIMELDYFAAVNLTRKVLPDMLKRQSGRVVFVSSVAGLVGTQYRASYAAAKAALHLWANSMRAELGGQGIQVNVIFPGYVKTDVSVNALVGDGSTLGSMDDAQAQAMSADEFAQRAVKGLLNNQEFLVIGGVKERFSVLLSRVSPRVLYQVIRRVKVR